MSAPARAFTVRHIQLLRAAFAAIAALMITFSSDHSAAVGLAVFSGFAIVTGFVLALSAWLAVPQGRRWSYVLLAVIDILAGMIAGIPMLRTDDTFFALVISWAILAGAVEIIAGIRGRRDADPLARDALLIGGLGILLAVALLLIPAGFTSDYTVEDAGTFQLTGIILGVGMLGGYAALVAVFLGIAGLTPARDAKTPAADAAPLSGGAA
ncbi:acyl-CoA synthetase [Microbacterium sp. CIAB417]|uniref:acyl-CoA synthetase n=1 Tax=Microbacterium sp. CIAB417 TaxID=2860287 RepID=UPI001FADBC2C|nr:acyl-CoA synthetase [Microbacterium sp. CIAB417]